MRSWNRGQGAPPALDAPFFLGFTSGTTGVPKGFIRTHASWLATFAAARVEFGSAAAGRVLKLDATRLAHALGIAGSLSAGLLAFSKAQQGAMVKRLHLGRAAESGLLAARLAR